MSVLFFFLKMSKRQKEGHITKGEYKNTVGIIENSVIEKPVAREGQQAPLPRIHEEVSIQESRGGRPLYEQSFAD